MTPATLAPPPPAAVPATTSPRLDRIFARLRQIVYEISGVEPERIDFGVPFSEMGVTSLLFVQIVQGIQEQLGVRIAFDDLLQTLTTFQAVGEHVDRVLPPDDPRFPAAAPAPVPVPIPVPEAVAAPPVCPPRREPAGPASDLERVLHGQLQLVLEQQKLVSQVITQQLEALGSGGAAPRPPQPAAPLPAPSFTPAKGLALPPQLAAHSPEVPAGPAGIRPAVFTPHKPFNTQIPGKLTARQQEYLDRFIAGFLRRTPGSRRVAREYRPWFADNRQSSLFRMMWKEICYQIMVERGAGARLWDVDGNEYVDIGMGFGILLFGHNPPFVLDAIRAQMDRGILLGPQTELASRVARLFCELTGLDRVLFCNSGTEAVIAAVRAARTVTRRHKIVIFQGSYHGWADLSAVRSLRRDGRLVTVPAVPGVTPGAAEDTLVLDWAVPESVEIIRANADELAAVLVEPVQSRRPDLQPVEMLREIRRITRAAGTAFIMDEMITGFRSHPGGVQALWGIDADLATYGKGIGGSLPVGAVAGKARFMDVFDGGMWDFGDDSYPPSEKTYCAGAFFKHPFTMAAAWAILGHMKEEGPALQERLAERTAGVVAALNDYLETAGLPVRAVSFRSLFRFLFPIDWDLQFNVLIFHLLHKGVFAWEGGSFFLSTAHTDEDLEHVVRAVKESFEEMRLGGFLPEEGR
jgi:glutamate-1-semialdehyde aminotransferase/acyl carrier protein